MLKCNFGCFFTQRCKERKGRKSTFAFQAFFRNSSGLARQRRTGQPPSIFKVNIPGILLKAVNALLQLKRPEPLDRRIPAGGDVTPKRDGGGELPYQPALISISFAFTQALGVIPVDFLKKSLNTDLELNPLS